MDTSENIVVLDRWVARVAECYPHHAAALLSKEQDPFRNPVGDTLRRSLSHLLRELLGEMDAKAIDSALDPIIRLQVVQGFSPDDKATLPTLMEYWVPGVEVAGVHELLGNALVLTGEKERTTDLRGEDLRGEDVHGGALTKEEAHRE